MTHVITGAFGTDRDHALGWKLHDRAAAEPREYVHRVEFKPALLVAPHVIASISSIDASNSFGIRAAVDVVNVSVTGFDLVFRTWSDSEVFGLSASWMAITA